jgi:hypothetical protein
MEESRRPRGSRALRLLFRFRRLFKVVDDVIYLLVVHAIQVISPHQIDLIRPSSIGPI